jgi:hypothetical protein
VENSLEIDRFCRALPTLGDERLAEFSDGDDARRWFMRNVGFFHDTVAGESPDLETLLVRWRAQSWGTRWLYLLDGLSVVGGSIAIGNGWIRPLGETDLNEYFNQRSAETFGVPVDTKRLQDRTFLDLCVDTVVPEEIYIGPRRFHPWLAYLNLCSYRNIVVHAIYERSMFLLSSPGGESLELRPNESLTNGEPVDSGSLSGMMAELQAGHQNASSDRVEMALKTFVRACDDAFGVVGEHALPADTPGSDTVGPMYPDERDAMERAVVDFTICLEAIYLDSARGAKSERLVTRAASLLSRDDDEVDKVRQGVRSAYDLRSRLVHGDHVPSYRELHDSVAFLRKCSRRSLAAFLRMSGDQQRINVGVDDRPTREANRRVVPE